VKSIVGRHGGEVEADSDENRHAHVCHPPPGGVMKVLVVDDDLELLI